MKHIISWLLLSLVISCQGVKENQVLLYNNLVFQTLPGESQSPIVPTVQDRYAQFFDQDNIQVPIYKYIKHRDYELYIGIPVNTSLAALSQARRNQLDSMLTSSHADSIATFYQYEDNDQYFTEYLSTYAGGTLIGLFSITRSAMVRDSLFNQMSLKLRVKPYN